MAPENSRAKAIRMTEAENETHAIRHLPGHLVENIVARIPFPYILKARLLSREWESKFPVAARESFLSWPEYFSYLHKAEVVGYDAVQDSVERMAVKIKSRRKKIFSRRYSQVLSSGPLLVAMFLNSAATSVEVVVNNVLTRKCKKTNWSFGRSASWYEAVLVLLGTENYELIVWYNWYSHRICEDPECVTFVVYNSASCSWMETSQITGTVGQNAAYMDGALYFISGYGSEPLRFVQVNCQTGDRTETPIQSHVDGEVTFHFTVRCGSDILTVISSSRTLIVSQFDTESYALVELSRSPILEEDSYAFTEYQLHRFDASRNRVYLTSSCSADYEIPLVYIYEVESKTWSRRYGPDEFSKEPSRYPHFVLELGRNPFVNP